MPVSILYYKVTQERISSAQQSKEIAGWINELPLKKQQQVNKLRQPKDKVLSLAGLQLLKMGMSELLNRPFSLQQLHFPAHAKPFIEEDIDFNISHSGDITCCVISHSEKVGIDIEIHRKVKAETINKFLITTSDLVDNKDEYENNISRFFKLWTKNEAIIKAANHGSIFNMKDIQHELHGGYYEKKFWYTYPVLINVDDKNKYTCHLAISKEIEGDHNKTVTISAKQIKTI